MDQSEWDHMTSFLPPPRYSHSASSLPSSQSLVPSHLQLADTHFVLDLHDHWNSAQSTRVKEQFCGGSAGY